MLELATYLLPDLQLPDRVVNRNELATVVRYTANAVRENAEKTGDYEKQFWSAVALSGLEMLDGNNKEANRRIEDACAVPSATRFFLQLLKERLDLLHRLKFKEKFVIHAIQTVDSALKSSNRKSDGTGCSSFTVIRLMRKIKLRVSRCSPPKRSRTGFAKSWKKIGRWARKILAICSDSTEGDVMFAERCLELNATVRLLMLEPTRLQLVKPFIQGACSEWTTRRSALLDHPKIEVWYHTDELGDPVEPAQRPEPTQPMDFEYCPNGSTER